MRHVIKRSQSLNDELLDEWAENQPIRVVPRKYFPSLAGMGFFILNKESRFG